MEQVEGAGVDLQVEKCTFDRRSALNGGIVPKREAFSRSPAFFVRGLGVSQGGALCHRGHLVPGAGQRQRLRVPGSARRGALPQTLILWLTLKLEDLQKLLLDLFQ